MNQQVSLFLTRFLLWIALSLAILIFLVAYFILIKPEKNFLTQTKKDLIENKQAELLSLKRKLGNFEKMKKEYNAINPVNFDKFKKILPNKSEIEELMKRMEILVSQNGLILSNLNIAEDGEETKGIGKITITMNILGTSYSGLKNLLSTIENDLRILDIKSLSFNPGANSTDLKITTYYILK